MLKSKQVKEAEDVILGPEKPPCSRIILLLVKNDLSTKVVVILSQNIKR
jgi:hypothetical protein